MPPSDLTQATDQVKRAEDLMKKLTAVDMAPAAAFIDEYITATTEPPRRIPEPVFRELFLPFFLGERPAEEQPELIAHWIGLIGSASLPADIVDATGTVLFQVPPVYDTDQLDTMSRNPKGDSFQKVFTNYADDLKVHPAIGARYLAEQLTLKLDTNLHGEQASSSSYSWRPALEYYKLVPTKTESSVAAATTSDDDFDFE